MSDQAPAPNFERHVSHRCSRMAEHYPSSNFANPLPIPCDQCCSVESIWRSIPYEPDGRTAWQSE